MSRIKLALDVVKDLKNLADSIETLANAAYGNETSAVMKEVSVAEKDSNKTLEEVRKLLADKSRQGYTDEVRSAILKQGAKKLSDVDPSKYDALLKELEDLE
jgi:hypothetical protein